jgi:hypothetical protein
MCAAETDRGRAVKKKSEWRTALEREGKRLRKVRKTCDHSSYKGFAVHGRCCPNCGVFIPAKHVYLSTASGTTVHIDPSGNVTIRAKVDFGD